MKTLQTIAETKKFLSSASAAMSDQEYEAAINYIAANPDKGISLGGGLRKIRVPRAGSGKSGGFRIIYVFGGQDMPIFLVAVFAKNEKDNLSPKEQAFLVELSKKIISEYKA